MKKWRKKRSEKKRIDRLARVTQKTEKQMEQKTNQGWPMLKNVHGLLPYNHNNFVVQVDGAFQFHKFDEKSYEKNNCHHRGIV